MFSPTDLRVNDYPPFLSMAPHAHAEGSINIVVQGGFLERIGRSERDYARGHIAFFPAGATHSQVFGAAGARQIIFRPEASWLDYLTHCRAKLDSAPHLNAPVFGQFGDRLIEEMASTDAMSPLAREGILLEIVAAFGRRQSAAQSRATPPAWLCRAREFLHANAASPLELAEIARAAGRHEIHLAREFRRFYGMPVGAYLRQLRSEHAARLLRAPHADISDIALACGFGSHSHLCRAFKAHFGITPSQYRCRHGNG
jgi:AraC family transcriptional regulator